MARIKLLNTAIVAKMLGLSADYIRRLCRQGKIKAEKIGTDWLTDENALKHITRKRKPKEKADGVSTRSSK
jgi:excisionase family DNA binding protein